MVYVHEWIEAAFACVPIGKERELRAALRQGPCPIHALSDLLICRGQRAAGSCGAVFARITVEPLELIGIDGAQHPRREGPLE